MTAGRNNRKSAVMVNAGLALLLVAMAIVGFQLIGTLRAHQRLVQDLAEVNDVKYGLLNADVWVKQVTAIIDKRINEFELTAKNREAIKPVLERALNTFITEADNYTREQNKAGGLTGKLKQGVQDALVKTSDLKSGIPRYADKILDEMNKPESRREIAGILKNMLSEAKQSTFAEVDKTPLGVVQTGYGCKDRTSCQQVIGNLIETNHAQAVWQTLAVLVLAALLFVGVWVAPGETDSTRFGLLVLCSTVLMLCGVLTPMMEVEARISELHFVLMQQPVAFENQVLYFRSKSVLDLAHNLISNEKLDIKLVGVLVITFSVIFPLLKLAASFVYLYDLMRLRQSSIVRFFVFKSGKWSMADVFVVAMLMSYIGFDALTSNQLSRITAAGGSDVHILTTNGTSLETGFFMFLAFCLASLLTSTMMESKLKDKMTPREKESA